MLSRTSHHHLSPTTTAAVVYVITLVCRIIATYVGEHPRRRTESSPYSRLFIVTPLFAPGGGVKKLVRSSTHRGANHA